MLMIFYFILSLLNFSCSSLTSEYYQNLINQKIAQADVYELPENNSEFRIGAISSDIKDYGSFDFIIVGAGSAGSVLATTLSEIHSWSILLLEAGDEEDDFNAIPAMFPYLQFSEMNWGYFTTPQRNCCLDMIDNKCMAPRGKSLGGSSAINAVLYVRGNAKDYDKWVELGNPGWSYKEVLPYFRKSENSQVEGDEGYHNKAGFWNVEYSKPFSETYPDFIQSNRELNQTLVDYNGFQQIGVSKTQTNIKREKRQSTSTAFLDNARKRSNLKIVTRALVTKLRINEDLRIVEGVEFVTQNEKFFANNLKEVIVSAGAINTPQLLMLSGIGPRVHLHEMGIKLIEDLPVGENLMEHPQFLGLNFRTNYTSNNSNLYESIQDYLIGLGPLTSTAEAVGFLNVGNTPIDVPMVKYIFNAASGEGIASRVYNFNEHLTNNYLNKLNSTTDITLSLILLHQKSRGRVTLKSPNPIDFPNIDLNLFSESDDINNLINGIDFIFNLTQTETYRRINATFIDIPICEEFEKFSKLFWECSIRHMSMTLYHPCGTAAMGPNTTNSVVDADLRVHGIRNLRVADASVFPSTISGPTNAAVVMVAEKISDVIKMNYKKNKHSF